MNYTRQLVTKILERCLLLVHRLGLIWPAVARASNTCPWGQAAGDRSITGSSRWDGDVDPLWIRSSLAREHSTRGDSDGQMLWTLHFIDFASPHHFLSAFAELVIWMLLRFVLLRIWCGTWSIHVFLCTLNDCIKSIMCVDLTLILFWTLCSRPYIWKLKPSTPSGEVLVVVLMLLLEWRISSRFETRSKKKPREWLAGIEPAPLHLRIRPVTNSDDKVCCTSRTTKFCPKQQLLVHRRK
jgi:hypothetical protein